MIDIHEELHRLVLRQRWIRWSLRNYRYGDYRISKKKGKVCGRMVRLSNRLTRWKPTFQQRTQEPESEMKP